MSEFNLGQNLANYRAENELFLLDNGSTHTVEITTAKSGQAQKGPKITVFGKVAAGPDKGKRVALGVWSFSPNAMWKTIPLIKGFGVTDDFLGMAESAQDPIAEIASFLVGRVADVTFSLEAYQGMDRNRAEQARQVAGTPQTPSAGVPTLNTPPPAPQAGQTVDSGPATLTAAF